MMSAPLACVKQSEDDDLSAANRVKKDERQRTQNQPSYLPLAFAPGHDADARRRDQQRCGSFDFVPEPDCPIFSVFRQ